MGVLYYGVCLDCKQYIDLDKFYSFAGIQDPSVWDEQRIEFIKDNAYSPVENFIFRSLRLQYFMKEHTGHRIGVYDEYRFTGAPDPLDYTFDSELDESKYQEVHPWPT